MCVITSISRKKRNVCLEKLLLLREESCEINYSKTKY